jgi:hypothetical protein
MTRLVFNFISIKFINPHLTRINNHRYKFKYKFKWRRKNYALNDSKVASVHFREMIIAVAGWLVRSHLVGIAFKAHTGAAPGAGDPVAAGLSVDGHPAGRVGALPDVVWLHVLFEHCLQSLLGLLACQSRVVELLALQTERVITKSAFEVVCLDQGDLFAPCGEAESVHFRMHANVLTRNQGQPSWMRLRLDQLLHVFQHNLD